MSLNVSSSVTTRTISQECVIWDQVRRLIYGRTKVTAFTEIIFHESVLREIPTLKHRVTRLPFTLYAFTVNYFDINSNKDSSPKIAANRYVKTFFERNSHFFAITDEYIRQNVLAHCFASMGFSPPIMIPNEFSDLDIAVLGLAEQTVIPPREFVGYLRRIHEQSGDRLHPRGLTCFKYALLTARERGVQELTFLENNEERNLWLKNSHLLIDKLHKWGYRQVVVPQAGDFVLYSQNGEPKHMGIYLGNNLVRSKYCKDSIYVYDHPVDLVWSNYGNEKVFYRKTASGSYRSFCPHLEKNKNGTISMKNIYREIATEAH